MFSILKDIIKVNIANIRWGKLTNGDEELVIKSPLRKVFKSSYIRKSIFSYSYTVTLD